MTRRVFLSTPPERLGRRDTSDPAIQALAMVAMIFPIDELLDEEKCYQALLTALHPEGLCCPEGHPLPPGATPHERHRAPGNIYRCKECHRVFHVFSGTVLQGIRFPCSVIVMILRGFCQGTPTLHLAQELGVGRRNLLRLRHRVQAEGLERFSPLWDQRPDRRSRRDVPERRREGHPPSRPR